ncbi:MAG: citramalate synthase [Pseudanabaenaceae cyanobacterium]
MKIRVYDTTLRDGAQTEGLALSVEDKLRIAHLLDRLGVDFIEGGWPGANPKDEEFFQRIGGERLRHSQIVAFCSTRRAGLQASSDPMLVPILAAQTQWVTIFGKSWDLHVTAGLRTTLEENLAMIADTIGFLRSQGRRVIYDAEHWFDGYKHNPDYALATLKTAAVSGAEWLVLCDTNGGTLPQEVTTIVTQVKQLFAALEITTPLGIHTHNDCDVAVANTIGAVAAGCSMVQGTINGYGERCGNANLCSVLPILQLKLGYECITPDQMTLLTSTAREISEIVNLAPNEHAPFVGLSAFAHKGGVHVSAVERNPLTYEHIPPETVGNHRRIVISEQAGLSNVLAKARLFGLELDRNDAACRAILRRLKELEQMGYQFEAAEASFELLMRAALDRRPHFFYLQDFHVHCQGEHNGQLTALATVKVVVKGEEHLTAAEGNGPVSALDTALRKALVAFYPQIDRFHLTDYKVRILNSNDGTRAKTRVLIESSNGNDRWTTVGVSSNIIAASSIALVESLEYGLMKSLGD